MDHSSITSAVRSIRAGDLDVRLPETDPETRDLASEVNLLAQHLADIQREISRIQTEIGSEGRLGGQAELPDASGAWKQLIDEVNHASRLVTVSVRAVSMVASKKAKGDFETTLTLSGPREFDELFHSINSIGTDRQLVAT